MTDEQQAAGRTHAAQRLQGLPRVEAAGERRMLLQAFALLRAPRLRGQLGGLAGPDLRAVQDRVEFDAELRERDAGGARLAFSALGEPTVGVAAGAVRLSLGVT